MFESITNSLNAVFRKLSGQGQLTEKNIQDGLREVRLALLQADVNFKVVKDFIDRVTKQAVGQEVIRSVHPAQQIVKIVHDELSALMGPPEPGLPVEPQGTTVVLMAGLQGSGKTTTCAKLAKHLMKKGHRPLLVAADLQRPAAVEQLTSLGKQLQIPVYAEAPGGRPPKVCERGVAHAAANGFDVVILDTAGRLHVDDALMEEVRQIAEKTRPEHVLLVCDAMVGQDAVNSAKAFDAKLPLTGVILTKLDGDARGGAALSVKAVTGKPIRFVGVGEKPDQLEEFYPERMADRILGMGDVVSLVERAQATIDVEQAMKMEAKLKKASFDLQDFLDQMAQVRKMGPLQEIMKMIPGMGGFADQVDEKQVKRTEAIIQSMTARERKEPDLIDGQRRRRIAKGSGTTVPEVNSLLKQFGQARDMMKKLSKMKPGMKPGGGGFPRFGR